MHPFKRALGVKIFLALWLLVALVPLWRLRATRQWQSDQFYQLGPGKPRVVLGLTPEREDELARRFPNDAVAQRLNFSRPYLGRSDSTWPSDGEMQKATDAYFSRYDTLLRRFPSDLPLRSMWLRDTTRGGLRIKSKGLTDSYKLPGGTQFWPNWMSNAQLERAIAIARESALMEPDNAYWRWMEAILDFSLRRDEAALLALDKAGKCARFDDGLDATTRNRIALMKRVQVEDFDDELYEVMAALFPHYARMRAAARQTMWQAHLAFERGDTKRALRIAEILQRASAPVARSRGFFIGRLVGEAMCFISWRQTIVYAQKNPVHFSPEEDPVGTLLRRAQVTQFADFARQNGRPDLAASALQLQASFNGQRIEAALKKPDFDGLWQAVQPLTRFHWLGAHLLRLALTSGFVWLAALLFSRRDNAIPLRNRRRLAFSSAFCMGATIAVLTASVFWGAVRQPDFFFDQPPQPAVFDFERNLPLLLAGLWGIPPLAIALLSLVKRPQFDPKSRSVNWRTLWPVLLYLGTFGSFFVVADALSQPLDNSIAGQLWPAPLVVFALCLMATGALHFWRAERNKRLSATLWAGSVVVVATTFLFYQSSSAEKIEGFILAGYCYAAFLALGGALFSLHAEGFKSQRFTLFWKQLLLGTRIAAATLAVCSTIFYFLLMGACVPFRHHAQQVLEAQIQKGEAAFVEARMEHLKPQNPAHR